MKESIHTIMAAVDRDGHSREVAAKAVALARLAGAHLELFHCDAERAYSHRHQYDARAAALAKESCLADSRRFLDSLWRSLAADDVKSSFSVACESPLYEGIVQAVKRDRPDLVVRGTGGRVDAGTEHWAGLDANDWELVRACPSPLLLTRGKPWKAHPTIAAAIDLSAGESAELTQTILSTAAAVARSAGGRLEIVHAARLDRGQLQELESRRAALEATVKSAGVKPADVHLLAGEPVAMLSQFAVQRDFDLIVLGALTHRASLTALVGTLTGRLLETLDCDFLLVKPQTG